MVLAELACLVAEWLQEFCDGRIFGPEAHVRAGHADLCQPGANWVLAGNERGAPGGTALLPVIIGEAPPLVRNSVDIGGAIPHLSAAVVADIPPTDIVSPKDEDVWFLGHVGLPIWIA